MMAMVGGGGAGGGGGGGAMGMGMKMPPPAPSPAHSTHPKTMMAMHMTFFWGDRTEILFSGWPGRRGRATYLLTLFFVLALAALAEALSAISELLSRRPSPAAVGGRSRAPATALLLTALHALRLGLAYLVMLALMSFNGGVFVAAVAGHALGFLLARSGLLQRARSESRGASSSKM